MIERSRIAAGAGTATLRIPDNNTGVPNLDSLLNSSARPFVLVSEREISVLRRGLTKDGWKRSLYLQPAAGQEGTYVGAGLLSVANRSLEMDVRIPARSGHFHHFFCDCGSRLSFPEDLLIAEKYVCPACGKTYSGERYDGAVRLRQHARLAQAALSCALVYAIEKDRAYAEKAAQILVGYARAYPGPHTSATDGGILYQSLDEAVWVIPLAQAYDLLYYSRSLSDKQRELVESNLFRPVADGLKNVGIAGNWGSWHLSAVGVIGLAIKDASLLRYALESFKSQIGDQLGEDGLWPESVHTYHFYPLSAFVHLAEGCYRAGIDVYNWEARPGKSLKAMFTAPLAYMYPSFRLPAINDEWFDSFLPASLYEIAYRRWNDALFAWVLKRAYKFGETPINSDQREHPQTFARNSFYAFMFGRDLPGRTRTPTFKSHDFPSLGICTLRNGDEAMATLDYGPFLGHGHLDKLGFTLYADDTLVVPDYGTPGYGSKILEWYTHTPAHNTVVVDGKSQEPTQDRGLTASCGGGCLQFAEAVAEGHYPGVRQTRRILLMGKICFLGDDLASEDEHDYDWLARFEGKPRVVGQHKSWDFDGGRYPMVDIEHAYRADGLFRIDWTCDRTRMAFAMLADNSSTDLALGTCPAETANRRVPLVIARQHGREARFMSLFAPSRSGRVDVRTVGSTVTIAEGESADHIYLKGLGSAAGAIETDGEIAAVRVINGTVCVIALVRGTYVKWLGEPFLQCPSKVDCVEISHLDRTPTIRYCCDTAGVIKLQTNARAMRVNGHRTAATTSEGQAHLRVTPQMITSYLPLSPKIVIPRQAP